MRTLSLLALVSFTVACGGDDKTTPDEETAAPVGPTDNDGDGVPEEEDCDDEDPAVSPEAEESPYNGLDDDCDPSTADDDLDGDGFLSADDCDDTNAELNPDANERCDGVDDDCDGEIDEAVGDVWYTDGDGDGFGDPSTASQGCEPGGDQVADNTDCDDADADTHPEALETCDGEDDDCDGEADEGVTSTFYQDTDGDGFGDLDFPVVACEAPVGYAASADDCDDGDGTIHPDAAEVCDLQDNDCDALIDDADDDVNLSTGTVFYADADTDGYGDPEAPTFACALPEGYAADDLDCDDADAAISPSASEVCDLQDNDCDSLIDDADPDVDPSTGAVFYADDDGDSFGDPGVPVLSCALPAGASEDDSDCDDADGASYPGAAELCDSEDNDCDGVLNNGVLGSGLACPGESCLEILNDGSSVGDGDYALDPDGSGAALYTCDMTTDGGGFTLVFDWDRRNDGDSLTDFESLFTENFNNMTSWTTSSTYLEWADGNAKGDVIDYQYAVSVPNGGEALFDLDFYGSSMEQSGVWFWATAGGNPTDLQCAAPDKSASNNCFTGAYAGAYTTAEQAYIPGYTCATTTSGNLDWESVTQTDLGAELESFHLTSLMCDTYGDEARLYSVALWVR